MALHLPLTTIGPTTSNGKQAIMGRWAWMLSMALLLPIGLPAGGARSESSRPRQRQTGDPLLATKATLLHREPLVNAPQVLPLPMGEPLQGLTRWHDGHGLWLRVTSRQGRGWIRLG